MVIFFLWCVFWGNTIVLIKLCETNWGWQGILNRKERTWITVLLLDVIHLSQNSNTVSHVLSFVLKIQSYPHFVSHNLIKAMVLPQKTQQREKMTMYLEFSLMFWLYLIVDYIWFFFFVCLIIFDSCTTQFAMKPRLRTALKLVPEG